MNPSISCVFKGFGDTGSIYISNFSAAQDISLLKSLHIRAIISVAMGGKLNHPKQQISEYLYIAAEDIKEYNIDEHLTTTYEFIEKARKTSNVLVHCASGASRSATVVISYLIRKYAYSLQYVLPIIKRQRSIINPNQGFLNILIKQSEKYSTMKEANEKPKFKSVHKNKHQQSNTKHQDSSNTKHNYSVSKYKLEQNNMIEQRSMVERRSMVEQKNNNEEHVAQHLQRLLQNRTQIQEKLFILKEFYTGKVRKQKNIDFDKSTQMTPHKESGIISVIKNYSQFSSSTAGSTTAKHEN